MSSVAFTRPSLPPAVGARGTMTSSTSSGRGGAAKEGSARSFGGSSGAGKAPLRHIDDIVSVVVDIDPHTPLRKLLDIGDAHMKQAITFRDFRRPDLALQEYIKAFTIAVDKVPAHKDYPSMASDRGDLNRLYSSLKARITTNGAVFDEIKEDIKEDNRRSGVQPTTSVKRSHDSSIPEHRAKDSIGHQKNGLKLDTDIANGDSTAAKVGSNTSTGRKPKPVVQPKPQALHGNAIKQTPKSPAEDLYSRFARLRDHQRTQSVESKEVPADEASYLVDGSMPAMPKLPEAIYSPARGTVTSEIANLPSSTPRGMFSRTNSITSAPTASARISTENAIRVFGREQFAAAHNYRVPIPSQKPREVRIPDGETITPNELANLIDQYPNVDILVIDVREREYFDEGHIRSAKTICIEPEILMRENISAEDIADSMVLAPSSERLAIEQRDKVDLVVIYDEDSTSIPSRITGNALEMVLYNIRQALSYYSYSRPLKDVPKLLAGGLNSWVDEFGERSLETSDTASDPPPLTMTSGRGNVGGRRLRNKTRTKTLSQNEIDQFEDIIKEDQTGLSAFDYVKSREDFIRRYPSITGAPESMTSPVQEAFPNGHGRGSQEEDFLAGVGPAPPRRPAPAIPRTRYSGLESRDDESSAGGLAMVSSTSTAPAIRRPLTGLWSGGNSCYCNSTIQVFLASPGLINDILQPDWPEKWRVSTGTEPSRPQLLAKIFKNLLQWLHKKQFEQMKATTLMHYMRSIHEGYTIETGELIKLGDSNQHDVDEVTSFFFDQLAAETNVTARYSYIKEITVPSGTNPITTYMVKTFWSWWRANSAHTFIDYHFASLGVVERTCLECGKVVYNADQNRTYYVVPQSQGSRIELEALFKNYWGTETVELKCSSCNPQNPPNRHFRSRNRLAKLPRLLRVYIRRQFGVGDKDSTPVVFPFELDLGEYSWNESLRAEAGAILGHEFKDGFVGSTEYELYAIQVHRGRVATSGHYWSFVKGPGKRETWILCNDTEVRAYSGSSWTNELRKLYDCPNNETPVQLFYKRSDIPYDWETQS